MRDEDVMEFMLIVNSYRPKVEPAGGLADSRIGPQVQVQPARSSPQQPLAVSMLQLIASADDFDGEYVRVLGFYRSEFEGTSIYLHREDYEQALSKNGLWVTRDEPEYDLKYVLIEGRFNAKHQGHMALWSGAIEDVTRMLAWPPPTVRPVR